MKESDFKPWMHQYGVSMPIPYERTRIGIGQLTDTN